MVLAFPRFVYDATGKYIVAKDAEEHADLLLKGWIERQPVDKQINKEQDNELVVEDKLELQIPKKRGRPFAKSESKKEA
jgi:hypothetical protein